VGLMYYRGYGVKKNYKAAAHWWELAAVQGLAEAQSDLGALYHQGLGVKRDHKKAARWYHAAAVQGYQKAQLNNWRLVV